MHTSAEPTFDDLLTAEALSALMRSTWTWDDRALRRDLSALLVDRDAAHAVTQHGAPHSESGAETLRSRALSSAAEFVAAVLGPKLIADAGNPLRQHFLDLAIDPARFGRRASSALIGANNAAAQYISAILETVDYPAESSWPGLVTEHGSTGLGSAMRAYGHTLSESTNASSFFASIGLAWQTVRAATAESPLAGEYVKKLEDGALTATLAVAEQSGSWDPALVRTRATPGPDGWQLTGQKQFVPAADSAEVYFVVARSLAGPSLFAVDSSAAGVDVSGLDVADPTRPLYQLTVADTPAVLVGREGAGGRLMMRALDRATTAAAAEQVGLIEKCITVVGDHATTVPSTLAELTLDHMAAVALWQRALAGSTDSAAAAAHIGCSKASVRAAITTAQVVGPSKETDALVRRALSTSLLFGGPALYYERLLERLGV